jgi:Nitroreductase family
MTLRETMISRRSVRSFKSEHPGRERIQELIDIAITAPSASNKQPWRFFVAVGFPDEEPAVTTRKQAESVLRWVNNRGS